MAIESPTNAEIGRIVAKRRTERNLTQDEVAERMSVGSEAISRIERGAAGLSVQKLIQFAAVFDCPVDDLLKETSNRPSDQGQRIAALIKALPDKDRAFIVEMVENLSAHMGRR